MSGWVWDTPKSKPVPRQEKGVGYAVTNEQPKDGSDFKLDDKTGLFLPEATVTSRRKVEIGFRARDEQ